MLKQITALVFLTMFALQTFTKVVIEIDYWVNTTAYAKVCENKAKPELRCKGKCQMMKKLEQEEKKSEDNPERKGESKWETSFPVIAFSFDSSVFADTLKSIFPQQSIVATTQMPRSIFHPPAA